MNKILLVEDDDMLGTILKDQLEMNGYEVTHLKLPKKTIEYLLKEDFNLVIMDKLLHGVDGTQVCAEIRETRDISKIPILMMSGMDGAKEICCDSGANNFIAKPFSVDNFLKSIEATLAMKNS